MSTHSPGSSSDATPDADRSAVRRYWRRSYVFGGDIVVCDSDLVFHIHPPETRQATRPKPGIFVAYWYMIVLDTWDIVSGGWV